MNLDILQYRFIYTFAPVFLFNGVAITQPDFNYIIVWSWYLPN